MGSLDTNYQLNIKNCHFLLHAPCPLTSSHFFKPHRTDNNLFAACPLLPLTTSPVESSPPAAIYTVPRQLSEAALRVSTSPTATLPVESQSQPAGADMESDNAKIASRALPFSEITLEPPITSNENIDLQTRLDRLPRELLDMIQDFTFIASIEASSENSDLSLHNGFAKHLAELKIIQLSRATRAQYAEAFYRRRNFVLYEDRWIGQECQVWSWLASVPTQYRAFIGRVTCVYPPRGSCGPTPLHHFALYAKDLRSQVAEEYGAEVAGKIHFIMSPHDDSDSPCLEAHWARDRV